MKLLTFINLIHLPMSRNMTDLLRKVRDDAATAIQHGLFIIRGMSYSFDKIMLITVTVFLESKCLSYQFSNLLVIFLPFLPYLYMHI